jgi:hypothetical protein
MSDTRGLFERQAAWQAGRRILSWPEKIRMAEAIRESVIRLRNMRSIAPGAESAKGPSPPRD